MPASTACDQAISFRRGELESAVLGILRNRLMQADAVAEFIAAYGQELNARRGTEGADRARRQGERAQIARKLSGLYDAIAEGLRTSGLKDRLEELEAQLAALDTELAAPVPSPVRPHPNPATIYRRKVMELSVALEDPEIRLPALETIRGLIERVTVLNEPDGDTLDLEGAITAMIDLAQPLAKNEVDLGSAKVVAGTRSHLHRTRLRINYGNVHDRDTGDRAHRNGERLPAASRGRTL